MNQHILDTLASLHSRLARLEQQVNLTGKHLPNDEAREVEFKMESLTKLKRDIDQLQRQRQQPNPHYIYMRSPIIATSEQFLTVFGSPKPMIMAHASNSPQSKYYMIWIFASERDDPFPFTIKYCPKEEHSSRDRYKARAGFIIEYFKCKTAQEVYEALESMIFPSH
jgi:hypothetical protein